ncbi:MAG: S-adenosylmethionine:tRNA ribosyltransferase-isomerase [Bacteroidia bacterium]|nr:S-adenosylmethionine:tRNA ribosyltransferase-isomerase [Bacteroidia bacterium]
MAFHPQSDLPDFSEIKLSDYHYELPPERIAKFPLETRDESRLLHYDKGTIRHNNFFKLPELLPENSLLVFNNTKVVKARLYFRRATGALIEVLLLNPSQPSEIQLALHTDTSCTWNCIIGNKKRWKEDEVLTLVLELGGKEHTLEASWVNKAENEVHFKWDSGLFFSKILEFSGKLPLPPYLNRDATEKDLLQYQTVYAKEEGAVAAPTAGLHFTPRVIRELNSKNIPQLEVTLHVGAGTFLPVKEEEVAKHDMHEEQLVIELEKIEALLAHDRQIIPVGTTAMRFLESIYALGALILEGEINDISAPFKIPSFSLYDPKITYSKEQSLHAIVDLMKSRQVNRWIGETKIYILPGYTFRLCQGIITNFHMPETTLMLLVAALVGDDWKEIYQSALDEGYRFLSYGDSSLLLPGSI